MSKTPVSRIVEDRLDMTEWVLHFVHERDIRNAPEDQLMPFEEYGWYPYHEDKDINYRFSDWDIMDESSILEPDASPMAVLRKIVTDGHIRGSWSFRNGRPTIYGPRAAVCFTEMPLYALIDYAKRRHKTAVDSYAVGLLKAELFAAGGRPVIYGLSGDHAEQVTTEYPWPRRLMKSCGIAESEQYRYVSTSMDSDRPIDWTHEREWRWSDRHDACSCPGIPIWISDEPCTFSRAILIVATRSEAEWMLDTLKELYDAGSNQFFIPFDKSTLENTEVISFEQLHDSVSNDEMRMIRLEDIPRMSIRKFVTPQATTEDLAKLSQVLIEARTAAVEAAERKWQTAPRNAKGHIADAAGFAYLSVSDSQSTLVSALLELGEAKPLGGVGYRISNFGSIGPMRDQAMCLREAEVLAAQEVFERHYPDTVFGMRSWMD